MSLEQAREVDVVTDRYRSHKGTVFLTGLQALTRLMIAQSERDRRAGLKIGGFVTGYPGSPLGSMEGTLSAAAAVLTEHDIRLRPAQNEELAATSLIGTQMIDEYPHPEYDGVVGYWYGKGPGIDRAGDALKHGNFAGTSEHGAVIILSGEDHEAKSSTVPYAQEFAFEHFGIPVLYPASVAEFITLGQHAVELSRYSGCWVSLKLSGVLCDGGESVDLANIEPVIVRPELKIDGMAFKKKANFRLFPIVNVATERELYHERHAAVRAYARANHLNRISQQGPKDRIGIIAAGKTHSDLVYALQDLGLYTGKMADLGIRILKLGMICPVEAKIVKEFAHGLDHILIVEEKRDFIERQVARIVCDLRSPPKITGKNDPSGSPVFPVEGGFDHDRVAELIGPLLRKLTGETSLGSPRLRQLADIRGRASATTTKRLPSYCSGCPHNTGTSLPSGHIAWGAPGCHVFAAIMPEPSRRIEAVTQYGGEGLPWIGLAPFTSRKHITQNVGDGSLFHSSYLNIRYSIAAGSNITFKILYNGAIANTGGQPPVGQRSVGQLTRLLHTEGVRRICLVTRNAGRYKSDDLPSSVELHDPADIDAVQVDLAKTGGVTVIIHDGECANERRRQQKRKRVPKPTEFTVVNEEVCENCGHCGQVSSCMSLRKTRTEFGEKTYIHQSSCNQDMSCVRGECPSFVTVKTQPGKGIRKPPLAAIEELGDRPRRLITDPFHICIPGVGGTGVITVNSILAQAATLDGYRVTSFDQTGAAQKWGPVLSSLILTSADVPSAVNTIGLGCCDLYLSLDLLAANDKSNLQRCSNARTAAVINSNVLPTGEMIRNVRLKVLPEPLVANILAFVDKERSVILDAGSLAESLFGEYMLTNMIAVGAAYQAGLLPISETSIEKSIRLSGVSTETNILAFRAGRLAVAQPDRLAELVKRPIRPLADRVEELSLKSSPSLKAKRERLMSGLSIPNPTVTKALEIRVEDLIDYQGTTYAERYLQLVMKVMAAECKIGQPGANNLQISQTVIANLHKVMAYKDEYEVARLLTQTVFRQRARDMFEGSVKLTFNLQPPFLRTFGFVRKVRVGEWVVPFLKVLSSFKFLRGTPADPFGYLSARKTERAILSWYIAILDEVCEKLNACRREPARILVELPSEIRGYEKVKEQSFKEAQQLASLLLNDFRQPKISALSA